MGGLGKILNLFFLIKFSDIIYWSCGLLDGMRFYILIDNILNLYIDDYRLNII